MIDAGGVIGAATTGAGAATARTGVAATGAGATTAGTGLAAAI